LKEASIVVKTYRDDLWSYVQLQTDLATFGHEAVRVCVPERDLGLFRSVLTPGFELVSSERLLRRFAFPHPVNENWYSQQLLKLLLVATSPTEACWVLDSNTLLMQPLPDPWQERRVVLALAELGAPDRSWFEASARFLGLPSDGPRIAPVNQPLRRTVVRALLKWIARTHGCPALEALVPAMIAGCRRGSPFWTEYGLYRSFAFHVAPRAHCYGDGIRDVAYYHRDRQGRYLEEWLAGLRLSRPHMVKFYARRPDYRLDVYEIGRICDLIRECR
jgi:hypothetical protein